MGLDSIAFQRKLMQELISLYNPYCCVVGQAHKLTSQTRSRTAYSTQTLIVLLRYFNSTKIVSEIPHEPTVPRHVSAAAVFDDIVRLAVGKTSRSDVGLRRLTVSVRVRHFHELYIHSARHHCAIFINAVEIYSYT